MHRTQRFWTSLLLVHRNCFTLKRWHKFYIKNVIKSRRWQVPGAVEKRRRKKSPIAKNPNDLASAYI